MWFDQLFGTGSFDFEKRCRMRLYVSRGAILLGLLTIALSFMGHGISPAMGQMCMWFGIGLIAGGIIKAKKSHKILKNPDLKKASAIVEMDERNQEIGVRCWAYSGYIMFLLLYIGILAGMLLNETIAQVLLVVIAVYAFLLFLFRFLLQRKM